MKVMVPLLCLLPLLAPGRSTALGRPCVGTYCPAPMRCTLPTPPRREAASLRSVAALQRAVEQLQERVRALAAEVDALRRQVTLHQSEHLCVTLLDHRGRTVQSTTASGNKLRLQLPDPLHDAPPMRFIFHGRDDVSRTEPVYLGGELHIPPLQLELHKGDEVRPHSWMLGEPAAIDFRELP